MRKTLPMLVILAAMIVVLVGLFTVKRSTSGPAGAERAGYLRIISIQNEGIEAEFKRAFEEWYAAKFGTRCEIKWENLGGTSTAVRFVKSEFAPSPSGEVPAGIGEDLFWGGGIEPYVQFSELGLLEPVTLSPQVLAMLPASVAGVPLQGAKHDWYGTALSGFGIIYNRQRLAVLRLPEPKTWEDLAAPEFFGEVGAADPRQSGTAEVMLEVVLEAYGWDKGFEVLARIGGNVKTFSRASSDIPKIVSMGDVSAALAIDFFAWTQIKLDGKEKIGFVLPAGLTPLTPDPIAVLKGAPNLQAAKRFIEFVLSPEGQRLWVLPKGYPGGPVQHELFRIPVVPEVYSKYADVTSVLFDPSRAKAGFRYDSAKAAARRDALKDLYGAIIVDLAPDLAAAWKAVIRRGLRPEEVKAFCAPPVTEQELLTLARTEWSKPAVRDRILSDWTNRAGERYRALASLR